jgi:hypothetical protein
MATGMTAYFKNELTNLKMKTGLNQFENMKLEPDWKDKANALVYELVAVATSDPFNKVKPDVIQRVLTDAVLNDKDFIGWNPKWVRITLNAWWAVYGGKILEAIAELEKKEAPPAPYTGPPIDVDVLINTYVARLKESPMVRKVPDVSPEEAKKEGKVRPKAHFHSKTDAAYIAEVNERIRRGREIHFRQNYPGATEDEVQAYLISLDQPKKKKKKKFKKKDLN